MSNYEIRYADEPIPKPGPVEIIMRNGVWEGRGLTDARYHSPQPIVESKRDFVSVSMVKRRDPDSLPVTPRPSSKAPRYGDRNANYRAAQAAKKCKVRGCGRPAYATGLCSLDYKRKLDGLPARVLAAEASA